MSGITKIVQKEIEIGDRKLRLKYREYSPNHELDIDALISMNPMKVHQDVITTPTTMFRIGLLVADLEEAIDNAELDKRIFVESFSKKWKEKRMKEYADKVEGAKKPTNADVETAYRTNPVYKIKYQKIYSLQRNLKVMNNIYWSLKAKNEQLQNQYAKLIEGLREGAIQYEQLEGIYNDVEIKIIE
jgi:hypothetical protein